MRKWIVPAALLMLAGLASPATARFGFPDAATDRAAIIEDVYVQIFWAATIAFLIVFALLAFVLIRYRENGGAGKATFEKERDNLKAEIAWTVIPLIVVMWVGVISYQALVDLDGIDEPDMSGALVIDIIASQYAWTAQYGNGVTVTAIASPDVEDSMAKAFHVPANHPLLFRITAVDVIHSFNVLGLATTIDAVPGQINELFVPSGMREGDYFTQCKEDCLTPGHSYMRAMVVAEPQADYDVWVEETLAGAAAGLQQVVPVLYDADGSFAPLKSGKVAKGAEVTLQLLNNGTDARTFTVGDDTVVVPAGALDTLVLNASATGTVSVMSDDGQSVDLSIIEPQVVEVELSEFKITPEDLTVAADDLVILHVTNAGNAVHNLYVGMGGGDGIVVPFGSRDLNNGESDLMLIDGWGAGSLEMWCAVPGHYGAGMFGTVTVA